MSVKCIMTEKPTWPDVLSERKSSDASSLVELMSRLTIIIIIIIIIYFFRTLVKRYSSLS